MAAGYESLDSGSSRFSLTVPFAAFGSFRRALTERPSVTCADSQQAFWCQSPALEEMWGRKFEVDKKQ